ncbi:MAG: Asp-tRNA(Asn)/Glu-tRNA(Gln) amidotransferase subunit GatB, partial [Gammaproteobacteria bacterium]|nr:Asp-tRNA(Asn)/Glu-tRNA(Gln) amidotransferase subunit GatB [Gammaproteobacteria bacterium]
GSFRCDVNVSVRKHGQTKFGTRVEIKNLNSFRFVERAIEFEVARQIDILEMQGTISQETRLFDATTGETRSLRSKEAAHDYRYFPDPDLLPLVFDETFVTKARQEMPELPTAKRQRFKDQFGLSHYDASVLVANKALADYFESVTAKTQNPKLSANWVMGDLSARLNEHNLEIESSPVSADHLAELLNRILDNTISGRIAKDVFEAMWQGEGSADQIIAQKGLKQITDHSALEAAIDQVIRDNPSQLADYRSGKDKLFGFFVGQVMKATQGKANPAQVNELLKQKLAG